jgi:hypothetical protein
MYTSSQATLGNLFDCFLNSAGAGCFVGDVDSEVESSSTVESLSYTVPLLFGYYIKQLPR